MSAFNSAVAATRPMRRDMFRAPWRLLAAVLLIALPVGFLVYASLTSRGVTTVVNSFSPSTVASYSGGTCTQSVDGYQAECRNEDGSPSAGLQALLEENLPAGFRVHRVDTGNVTLTHEARSAAVQMAQHTPDTFSTLAPVLPGPGEVYLPAHVTKALHVDKGDRITAALADGTTIQLTVLGTGPGSSAWVTSPTLRALNAPVTPSEEIDAATQWSITGPSPLTWAHVKALNKAGFVVRSEELMENPPPASERYSDYEFADTAARSGGILSELWTVVTWASMYGIGLMLVLLLISPVFALALNRHTRMFALMSTQGSTPGQIALAVLTYALFAGLLGATLGGCVGGIAGWIHWSLTYPGWDLEAYVPTLMLIWLTAILGAVAVAFIPARLAARSALAAALGGAEPDRIVHWRRWMAYGPAILVVLAALAWASTFEPLRPILRPLALGPTPVLISLIAIAASAPALAFGKSQLLRKAGLTGRFAGRGLLRSSMRSIPAIAAITAFTFTAVLVTTDANSYSRQDKALSQLFHPGEVALITSNGSKSPREDSQGALEILGRNATVTRSWELEGVFESSYFDTPHDASLQFDFPGGPELEGACHWVGSPSGGYYQAADGGDPRTDPGAADACLPLMRDIYSSGPLETSGISAIIVDESNLDLWTFESPADRQLALTTLRRGGIVTSKDGVVSQTPQRTVIGVNEGQFDTPEDWTQHEVLAVAALPAKSTPLLVSREAARSLGLPVGYLGTAALLTEYPPQQDRIYEQVNERFPNTFIRYTSYSSNNGWIVALWVGAISLVALVLIIALSAQSIRREDSVLHAVGAHPGMTAKIAALQSWAVGTAAMFAGVLSGHLAVVLSASRNSYNINGDLLEYGQLAFFRPDWWLIGTAVVVPLLAAGIAWMVHRPRASQPLLARDRATDRFLG